jgi:uncharacterized protein with FMN-binding domain
MRRATIALLATVAGVAWILGYKVTPHTSGVAATPSGQPAPTAPADQVSPGPGTVGATPSPTQRPAGVTGSFTGSDVPNRFGDVQVRLVISNGKVSEVQAIQLPSDRAQSAYISQVAGPILRNEVIQAQSARIDIVSGATYTSQSYAQSVESALQQAHLG